LPGDAGRANRTGRTRGTWGTGGTSRAGRAGRSGAPGVGPDLTALRVDPPAVPDDHRLLLRPAAADVLRPSGSVGSGHFLPSPSTVSASTTSSSAGPAAPPALWPACAWAYIDSPIAEVALARSSAAVRIAAVSVPPTAARSAPSFSSTSDLAAGSILSPFSA